ncbi:MAG TPA: TonB-dependent receptor [Bacteroidales bacterium]|nr:TonB-dependent receptor [Bacteroidales bacterium]
MLMKQKTILIISFILISVYYSFSQEKLKQTLRGVVVDRETQIPLPGVNIILPDTDPQQGTISDDKGYFKFEEVNIGRQTIQASYIGYKTKLIDNIVINSAKETVIKVELDESITEIGEVIVKATIQKDKPLNKMATISARSFTVDETSRYPGSYGDPARMAANYAGVMSVRDNRNDIVIRGNSSTGLLWRLDGVEIPNPNHFAASGTTGGPITILNNNLLTNSDFLTGAFPAEYGNALAGVFDLKMRNGNNEKREYWAEFGYNGLEFGAEGPFSNNGHASYLITYRYSLVDIIDLLGAAVETTKYQDLTLKLNFPMKKGRLSLIGIGGKSYIEMFDSNDDQKDWTFQSWGEDLSNGSDIGTLSLSYTHFFGTKTRLQTALSVYGSQVTTKIDTLSIWSPNPSNWAGEKSSEVKTSLTSHFNTKINSQNTFNFGVIADRYFVNFADSSIKNGQFRVDTDVREEFDLFQAYAQFKHKFTNDIELYLGLHGQFLDLNNTYSIEPRMGFSWNLNEKNTFKIGYGLHSQTQLRIIYFTQTQLNDGTSIYTNKNLDFSKSHQIILGYDHLFSDNLRLKFETYYQYLYDIPVKESLPEYSVLNFGAEYFIERIDSLTNDGTGENYGIELTLERFLKNNFYFLITSSLYQSKYSGYDGIKRNTAFNGNFAINALGGYEIPIKKNNAFIVGLRATYAGGRPYVPYDVNATIEQHNEVLDWANAYEVQQKNYFRINLRLGIKRNKPKFNVEIAMDLQYRTNYTSVYEHRIDPLTGQIYDNYEMALYPMASYRIQF